jgi:hypothetical protein
MENMMKDEQDKALDNLMAWQQEFDKPVAWMTDDGKIVSNREKERYDITFGDYCIPLYTAPRELSDEEIEQIAVKWYVGTRILPIGFARAILKKASEK